MERIWDDDPVQPTLAGEVIGGRERLDGSRGGVVEDALADLAVNVPVESSEMVDNPDQPALDFPDMPAQDTLL